MLQIYHPNYCQNQIRWILKVIFSEFLGITYSAKIHDEDDFKIHFEGKELILKNIFFKKAKIDWLKEGSLPKRPIKKWQISDLEIFSKLKNQSIPLIYGESGVSITDKTININLDIFGSIFFMLSRYEEVISNKRDQFERFSATDSLAYKESLLNRAIVNEYLDILWYCIKALFPELEKRKHKYNVCVSADVDEPYSYSTKSFSRLVKRLAGDIVKRQSLKAVGRTLINYYSSKNGNYDNDPFFPKFKWMMDTNELLNNQMTFYFLVNNQLPIDGFYKINEPIIEELIQEIVLRGHNIGLHASFNSYLDQEKIIEEVNIAKSLLKKHGIESNILESRQHYLRWETPSTPRLLDEANVRRDASMGFADHIGFRAGTCYEYTFFDVQELKELDLIIKPLIFMEVSLFSYMGFPYNKKAFEIVQDLKNTCKHHNGTFTVLWHNSQLYEIEAKEFYKKIIS